MIRSIVDLAAVMTDQSSRTVVLVWKDGGCRVIFETGSRMDSSPAGDVDSAIRLLTSPASPLASGQVSIHRVPATTKTESQVLEWLQAIPGVSVVFRSPVRA